MIREYPVINTLDFSYRDEGGTWRTLNNKATKVDVVRGGKRAGVGNKIDVGTLSADLFGDLDLDVRAMLRPGTPIRVAGRNGVAGSALFTQPTPGTGTGWNRTAAPPVATLVPITAARPAKGTVAAGTRLCYGWTPSAAAIIGSEDARNTLSRFVSNLPPNRRFRITAQISDWDVSKSAPFRLQASVRIGTAYTEFKGTPRRPNERLYTDLPTLEFDTYDWDGPSTATVWIAETRRPTVPANSSGVWMGYDVLSFKVEMLPLDPDAVFTGQILDLTQREELDLSTGRSRTFTTILGVDNVSPIANTTRYGAIVEQGGGYENWEDRIRRLAASSPVPCRLPGGNAERRFYTWDGWTRDGWQNLSWSPPFANDVVPTSVNVPPTQWPQSTAFYTQMFNNTAAPITTPIGTQGYKRVLTDLTPGATYRIEANATTWENPDNVPSSLRIGIAGLGTGAATAIPPSPQGAAITSYQFTATGRTHTIQISNAAAFTLAPGRWISWQVQAMKVTQVGRQDPYRLQDIVYEGNLASHFDLACNSTGAYWWVDSNGIVQFRAAAEPQALAGSWTDNPNKLDLPGQYAYVDVSTSYDTKGLVTSLTLEQHGMVRKEDGTLAADDYASTFNDALGRERWGVRGDSLDTCLYTGPGFGTALATRAAAVFAERARTARTIVGFKWNAQENTARALTLEIYDSVRVERGKLPVNAQIIGLRHTITPTRWMVDVALTDIKTGVTFDELNRGLNTRTFDQWDTIIGARTFAELNADILKGLVF